MTTKSVYAIIDAHEQEAFLDCGCRLERRPDDVVELVPCRVHLDLRDPAVEVRSLGSELATAKQELEAMRQYARRLCLECGAFAREAAQLRERVGQLEQSENKGGSPR